MRQLKRSILILLVLALVAAHAEPAAAQAIAENREAAPVPVPIKAGQVALTPKNTTIQFVGLHTGDEPKPRTGYFVKFKGLLFVDEATGVPQSADVEIETASLITPIRKLTNHLQSPDFFSVKEYPKAGFKSTKIEAIDAAAGKYKLTGELTIRDITKSFSFPAVVKVTAEGVTLSSKFKLKRSQFGITYAPDRVVEEVAMTITVGKQTPKVKAE